MARSLSGSGPDARSDAFRDALEKYNNGSHGVDGIVRMARDYKGPCTHLLWDHDRMEWGGQEYVYEAFDVLTGDKMAELVRALIAQNPNFPTLLSDPIAQGCRRSFLNVALNVPSFRAWKGRSQLHENSTFHRVLLLLAAPGTTRLMAPRRSRNVPSRYTPLHHACHKRWVDPELIHRLLDLDPDVLMLEDDDHRLPLEYALQEWTPKSTFISRMMMMRPQSLCHHRPFSPPEHIMEGGRSWWHQTPVMSAFCYPRGDVAAPVGQLTLAVSLRPESVRTVVASWPPNSTALLVTIEKFPDRGLVEKLVGAYPPALCIGKTIDQYGRRVAGVPLLPHELAAARCHRPSHRAIVELLRGEMVQVAVAAIEHLHGGAIVPCPAAAAFQRRVKAAVSAAVPAASSASPMCIVQAIRCLPLEQQVELCASLFKRFQDAVELCRNTSFRDAVLGDATMGLYALNRHDRTNPSPHHQVRLLSLVNGSSGRNGSSLDCVFVQFREHGAQLVRASRALVPAPSASNVPAVTSGARRPRSADSIPLDAGRGRSRRHRLLLDQRHVEHVANLQSVFCHSKQGAFPVPANRSN